MNNSLSLLFSHSFDNPIWKILPDETSGKLMIQLKQTDGFASSYHVLSLDEKCKLDKVNILTSQQMETIIGFQFPFLLLQIYTDDTNPESRAWVFWDLNKKRKIPTLGAAFLATGAEGFCFQQGEEIRRWSFAKEQWEVALDLPEPKNTNIVYPAYFEADEEDFALMAHYLQQTVEHRAVLGIEYLEYRGNVFMSYYILNTGQKFDNYLICINNSGNILLHRAVNFGAKGIGRDTFFIFAGKLIFFEGTHVLSIYEANM